MNFLTTEDLNRAFRDALDPDWNLRAVREAHDALLTWILGRMDRAFRDQVERGR